MGTRRAPVQEHQALTYADKVAMVWFGFDAFTHLSMELIYLYVTWVYNGAVNTDSPLAFMWNEYGKADKRWAVFDANIFSLELLTVFGMGPLALVMMYAIAKRSPWRHFAQVVICTSELYGGWMTFAPEWVTGNPNLSNGFLHVWVYLFFMNFVWVLIPVVLLWDSAVTLTRAVEFSGPYYLQKKENRDAIDTKWYNVVAGTLVLYAVAVPAVLLYAMRSA